MFEEFPVEFAIFGIQGFIGEWFDRKPRNRIDLPVKEWIEQEMLLKNIRLLNFKFIFFPFIEPLVVILIDNA